MYFKHEKDKKISFSLVYIKGQNNVELLYLFFLDIKPIT